MSNIFETDADEAILRTIERLCDKIRHTNPASEEYTTIVNNIATLRSSLNAPIGAITK